MEVTHQGKTVTLDVPEGESILSVALDKKIDLPHDCKLGVCMTCPAKLVSRWSACAGAAGAQPAAVDRRACTPKNACARGSMRL